MPGHGEFRHQNTKKRLPDMENGFCIVKLQANCIIEMWGRKSRKSDIYKIDRFPGKNHAPVRR